MLTELKSGDEYRGAVKKMERNLESKKSTTRPRQISKPIKGKEPLAHDNAKVERKCEVVYPFGQPYINQSIRSKKERDNEHAVQQNPSGSFQKHQLRYKMEKQDELVRHMSNLPAYLQQAERQKNVQEKALNFGVLDWKRLEKWKYNERMPTKVQRKVSSSVNSLSTATATHSVSKPSHRKQSSAELSLRSSHQERMHDCVQKFPGKFTHTQDFQNTSSRTASGLQINNFPKVKSSRRSYSETEYVKGMIIKVDQKEAATTPREISSSSQIKETSLSSVPITDQYRKTKTTKGDCSAKYSADEPRPIVLLVPKVPAKKSSAQSSRLSEPRTSCDVDLAQDNRNRGPDCVSSQELHLAEPYGETSRSCPLPAAVAIAQAVESDACAGSYQDHPQFLSRPSQVKCLREGENSSDDCLVSVETSKGMDSDTAEQPAIKGRHSSPIRRFSLGLGRLSRSFSFKESSTVPQLSSTYEATKSGPASSGPLAGVDDCYTEKAHAGERRRSSPLRRLLDPILKHKGAHSARMVQASDKGSISVSSEPINTSKPVQDQQAILQLTIKNGLPYFKFAVDNSSDILAAAVTKPPLPGKEDCKLTYTFYSVREIKKTGGWISHGSKEKSCSISYNVLGKMKFIYCFSEMRRESVLYTVDVRKGEKGPPLVSPNKEIVATIVKDPAAVSGRPKDESECKQEGLAQCSMGGICNGGEKENFNGTIVILPGGVHSSPTGHKPSSLIDRWKSGGLCDCGGWDIGCKLRVLTDNNQESNCMTSTSLERIDLFNQNKEGKGQPNFSLISLKDGLYSVKFKASLSSLEAFSISVSIITSKKLPDILDTDFLPEAKPSAELVKHAESIKNTGSIQVQTPAKYVPSPPPSPVGRI